MAGTSGGSCCGYLASMLTEGCLTSRTTHRRNHRNVGSPCWHTLTACQTMPDWFGKWCARQDSNLRPLAPEAESRGLETAENALKIRLFSGSGANTAPRREPREILRNTHGHTRECWQSPVGSRRDVALAAVLSVALLYRAFHQLESGRLFTLPRPLRRGMAISLLLSPATGLPIDAPPVAAAPLTAAVAGVD